jgi:hypothetical protein
VRQRIQELNLVVSRLKTVPLPTDKEDYPAVIALLEDIDRRGEEAAYDRFMGGSDEE